ncbi:TPA: hypothetical protein ACSY4D_02150 [Listeria monocytogenes]|nr:hypothetical protein [Listeria monocytogenes]EHQ6863678.1 hypothetical protein [Listeria monocytogenes]
MFNEWIRLASVIPDYIDKLDELKCPNCKHNEIHYVYVGDLASRIGFEVVWCNNCLRGIQISRVRVPENVSMLSFKGTENLDEIIPKFKPVTPEE